MKGGLEILKSSNPWLLNDHHFTAWILCTSHISTATAFISCCCYPEELAKRANWKGFRVFAQGHPDEIQDDQHRVMMSSHHKWMYSVLAAASNTNSSCKMKMRDVCYQWGQMFYSSLNSNSKLHENGQNNLVNGHFRWSSFNIFDR